MSNFDISIVISTYNRQALLLSTIESVLEQDFEYYEIIVVDNACSEDTKKIVESFKTNRYRRSIRYICEPNIGLHNARHAGAKAAKGNILLYIDDDVVADKNLLREIMVMYSDSAVGCVGGKILPKWEVTPPGWIGKFPKWYLSILDDEDGPKEVQWIYGCNFSIRRDLLFELGGFNPDAFGDPKMWWYRGDGEIGLLRKVHMMGKKVIYNPHALVWHFIPKIRLTVDYFRERAFKSGIEASFSKYHYHRNGSFNPLKMIFRASVFVTYYIVHILLGGFGNVPHKVRASHFRARCFYEIKLMTNKNLQKFVGKTAYGNIPKLYGDFQQHKK